MIAYKLKKVIEKINGIEWKRTVLYSRAVQYTCIANIGWVCFTVFRENDVVLHDLRAIVKHQGYGSKLLLIALKKMHKLGINKFYVQPQKTAEAKRFWGKYRVYGGCYRKTKVMLRYFDN